MQNNMSSPRSFSPKTEKLQDVCLIAAEKRIPPTTTLAERRKETNSTNDHDTIKNKMNE